MTNTNNNLDCNCGLNSQKVAEDIGSIINVKTNDTPHLDYAIENEIG